MESSEDSAVSCSRVDLISSRAKRMAHTMELCSLIAAAVLAVFYLATSIYIASHCPYWFDEILTVDIAHLPDYRAIWSAVTHAVDGGSPLYDVVVRVSGKLLGNREVAARLPSSLAMVAGMLIVFDCARRLTNGLHGLIAFSILTCSFLPYYGHEARSYAIYFMLAALSLWIWVQTRGNSRSSTILFGTVIFFAVAMHYYAVLLLVPYALWEISRWKPWQPPSPKLIAGVLGAVVALAILSPAILAFAPVAAEYDIARPSLSQLQDTFSLLFPDFFVLALMMIWIGLAGADRGIVLPSMRPGEAIGWLFLCIPLAGFLAAELKTNAFLGRYFIGALPGIAVAFSTLLWRNFRSARRISLGVLLILATWGVAKQVMKARHPESANPATYAVLSLDGPLQNDGKRFLVFPSPILYLEARYYAEHPERYAFLLESDDSRKVAPFRATLNLGRYYPVQSWKFDDLRKHARETAVIAPSPRVLETLKQAGFDVDLRFLKTLEVAYLK